MKLPKFSADVSLGQSKRAYSTPNALWGAIASVGWEAGSPVFPSQDGGMEDWAGDEGADFDESAYEDELTDEGEA
jgi:hypothetical protein